MIKFTRLEIFNKLKRHCPALTTFNFLYCVECNTAEFAVLCDTSKNEIPVLKIICTTCENVIDVEDGILWESYKKQ